MTNYPDDPILREPPPTGAVGRSDVRTEPRADMVPPAPVATSSAPVIHEETHSETYSGRRDRVRWGPIFAGLVVTVGTYLILQFALITSGLVDLPAEGNAAGFWSAAAAVVAFILGGITAGASASWGEASDGVLQGVVMWAVTVVVLVVLASIGSGVALGALDTTEIFDDVTTNLDTTRTMSTARDAAGWALIGLSVALAASAIGGAIGAKMWPRREVRETELLQTRRY
jgi:hypothetical protein